MISYLYGLLKPHPKVLVVDSDPATGRMLRVFLESERYRVLLSRNGAEGLARAVQERPDVVILELDLPDRPGLAVLGALREWSDAPVLILCNRSGIADKIRALDAGANDCMAKPFAPEELAARLRVLLRCETPMSDGPLLVNGALRIDMATREMTVNGSVLELTATEEVVLYILARYVGRLVPSGRLIRIIWGIDAANKIHDLRVHIAHLRRKLEKLGGHNLIRREGNGGYTLALVADRKRTALNIAVG